MPVPEPAPPSVYECVLAEPNPEARRRLGLLMHDYYADKGGLGLEDRLAGLHRQCRYYEGLNARQMEEGRPLTNTREYQAAVRLYERVLQSRNAMRETAAIWARDALFRDTGVRYAASGRAFDDPAATPCAQPRPLEPDSSSAPSGEPHLLTVQLPGAFWTMSGPALVSRGQLAAAEQERLSALTGRGRRGLPAGVGDHAEPPGTDGAGHPLRIDEYALERFVASRPGPEDMDRSRAMVMHEFPNYLQAYDKFEAEARRRLNLPPREAPSGPGAGADSAAAGGDSP